MQRGERDDKRQDTPKAAERIRAGEEAGEQGDEEEVFAGVNAHGVVLREHDESGECCECAGEGVEQGVAACDGDAGVCGGARVGANHVDGESEAGVVHDVPDDGAGGEEDEKDDGDAAEGAVAEVLDEFGHAGDAAAAGQPFHRAFEQDHRAEGDEDGVSVKPRDHQANQRAYQAACEQGGGEGEDARAESGILKDLGEDDGGEQAADVGDVGNGEVQSAGDDGHEHCQRQDAQLRQLDGD